MSSGVEYSILEVLVLFSFTRDKLDEIGNNSIDYDCDLALGILTREKSSWHQNLQVTVKRKATRRIHLEVT
jgi:hypothetical protein